MVHATLRLARAAALGACVIALLGCSSPQPRDARRAAVVPTPTPAASQSATRPAAPSLSGSAVTARPTPSATAAAKTGPLPTLVGEQPEASLIRVDDQDVFVVAHRLGNGYLVAMPKAGGSRRVLESGPGAVDDDRMAELELHGKCAYLTSSNCEEQPSFRWVCLGEVQAMAKIPGAARCGKFAHAVRGPHTVARGLAMDATSVYWLERVTTGFHDDLSYGEQLVRAPIGGGQGRPIGPKLAHATAVAAADGTAFVVDAGSGPGQGRIVRIPANGIGVTELVVGQTAAMALAVDTTRLYWLAGDPPTLFSIERGAPAKSAPVTLATEVSAFALDVNDVYFAGRDGLMRVPKDRSAPPKLIFEPQDGPQVSLAVDATSVFYLGVDGRVMRVAK